MKTLTASEAAKAVVRRNTVEVQSGEDTGGAYCLLDLSVAPGLGVPRHIHTREDEAYFVLSGELEAIVGDEVFVLKANETLIALRDIPHQLRDSGDAANHYLIIFAPWIRGFLEGNVGSCTGQCGYSNRATCSCRSERFRTRCRLWNSVRWKGSQGVNAKKL